MEGEGKEGDFKVAGEDFYDDRAHFVGNNADAWCMY
jgi:hypothetical protein